MRSLLAILMMYVSEAKRAQVYSEWGEAVLTLTIVKQRPVRLGKQALGGDIGCVEGFGEEDDHGVYAVEGECLFDCVAAGDCGWGWDWWGVGVGVYGECGLRVYGMSEC